MTEPATYLIEFEWWVFEAHVSRVDTPQGPRAIVNQMQLGNRPVPDIQVERVTRAVKTLALGYYQEEKGVQTK